MFLGFLGDLFLYDISIYSLQVFPVSLQSVIMRGKSTMLRVSRLPFARQKYQDEHKINLNICSSQCKFSLLALTNYAQICKGLNCVWTEACGSAPLLIRKLTPWDHKRSNTKAYFVCDRVNTATNFQGTDLFLHCKPQYFCSLFCQ